MDVRSTSLETRGKAVLAASWQQIWLTVHMSHVSGFSGLKNDDLGCFQEENHRKVLRVLRGFS